MSERCRHCLDKAIDDQNRLRVHLVPMPSGDNPWKTQGDYREEQKRDAWRFYITIASLALSTVGTVATAIVAIYTISSLAP